MKNLLAKIIGDPGRSTLENRIYNALTFLTPLATVFVMPLIFILEWSVYHIVSVLLICGVGFYLYYLSRFRKTRMEPVLFIIGLMLLVVIWITGYGSIGYAFLFFQFLVLYSLLVFRKTTRMAYFLLVPAVVLALVALEYFGITLPKNYLSHRDRTIDFSINFIVWFMFTGFIIKVIIDNFRVDRQLIEDELIVAQKLQLRLLPQSVPTVPGFSMNARYLPMARVGGDFYDYRVSDDAIDILIADVSGHGLPGAFLATITKMAFEYERSRSAPAAVLAGMNAAVLGTTVDSNFVTAFYCSIDRASKHMRCASAGHVAALLYRRALKTVEVIKPRGKPLGWVDDLGAEERVVNLSAGDRLVLYTDGITECCNSRGHLFGTGAFTDAIIAGAGLSAHDFIDACFAQLRAFSGADHFEDDITLIVFDVL